MDGPVTNQRGNADPKALVTASSGMLGPLAGYLDIGTVATVFGGIVVPAATLWIFYWSKRRQLHEQKRHNRTSEDIQRGDE